MPTPIKVLVVLPAYGRRLDAAHAPMWLKLGVAFEAQKEQFSFLGAAVMDECNLARVRNALLQYALEQQADWVLTVDADTSVRNAEALLDMICTGAARGAAVIAAPVRHRNTPTGIHWNVQSAKATAMPVSQFQDKVAPVHAIGAAVMAIDCNWLRIHWASVNPNPWFQFQHVEDNLWVGEDLAFCAGVIQRGGQIFCDGRVQTVHRTHGEYLE